MAEVRAYAPINLIDPDVWYGDVIGARSNELVISDGYNMAVYLGRGFVYSGDYIVGGTMTAYGEYAGGTLIAEAFGFQIPAAWAASYMEDVDLHGLFSLILSGDDLIVGSQFDDVLAGYAGNDVIYGGPGFNYIDGGSGIDTAVYDLTSTNYSLYTYYDHMQLVGGGVDDILVSIERLDFADGTLAFDSWGTAGQAYRLYQAAFDRMPDPEGLGYWIGRLDSGTTSLNAVADSFLNSPEFVRTYGTEQTVSNSHFVELLYVHTLGRDFDPGGFNYWVNRLDNGQTNRGDLLAFFSESDENYARVAPDIEDGIWYV